MSFPLCLCGSLLPLMLAGPASAEVRLRVNPPAVVLDGPRAEQQLLVTATTPAGRVEDVTRKAVYEAASGWLAVQGGRLRALRDGQGRLRIRYRSNAGRIVSLVVPVTARGVRVARPVSFVNEVIPALTLAGCNQGACHGGQFGRGGLRLSLLGFDPESDYSALAMEGGGRRIARSAPERSLLLLKGTLALPHGGGRRLETGSPALVVLSDWIASGAPGPRRDEPALLRIVADPSDRLLRRGQAQQLRVTAHYSGGTRRDVTRQALYTSTNDGIASVDGSGQVHGVAPGAAAVMVRYQGQVAVARVALPFARPFHSLTTPSRNFIDTHVQRTWRRLGLQPSPPCTDSEFIRRASLDLTGTLPSPERVEKFLAECDAGKKAPALAARARLVDELLARPEWADYWTLYFSDLLRNTQRTSGEKGMWVFWGWLRESLRGGKPYNEIVRELIAGRGSASRNAPANYYTTAKLPEEMAEATSQVFLGVRLACAKCHNHPFEKWTQADYYGLAAFFPGVRQKQSGQETLILHTAEGEVRHPRTNMVMVPKPPDGPARSVPGEERPRALAEWLADPKNPFVARNIVNRIWARLMGHGLIEPVDDVRVSNPPSHPELLDELTAEFVRGGFDLKGLMRTLATSSVYGLSSRPPSPDQRTDGFYTHYPARRLSAEQLLDAISAATGKLEKFPGLPAGFRAISLPDPAMARSGLLDMFGRPARMTPCECERSNSPSLGQTLYLINSGYIHDKISDARGVVVTLIQAGRSDEEILRHLYLATLARPPDPRDIAEARRFMAEAENRREGLEDVLWTLLNSQEFLLNH